MEHQCKQVQLLIIEPIGEEPEAMNVYFDHEGIDSNEDVGSTIHTMNALTGYSYLRKLANFGTSACYSFE